MSLDLDERQRAMLAEMGIRLFTPVMALPGAAPAPTAARAPVPAAVRPQPVNQAVPAPAAPVPATATGTLRERPAGVADMDWPALREAVAGCQACKLCERRRNTVFGVGDEQADWLIVGEAPGENEDIQGEPFVGQAGKLLDNMLRAIGLARRERVYIANVLKCRPPGNRNPAPEEIAQCAPYLLRQIELLQPKIILAMGRFAINTLLAPSVPGVDAIPVGKLRGQVHRFGSIPVIVSYHPAYLLRNLPEKGKAWADLCLAHEVMTSP